MPSGGCQEYLVEFQGVTKEFGHHTVLSGINLRLAGGQIAALLGPSGCGKTTILRLLAGQLQPSSGKVTNKADHHVGYVFQEPRLLPWLTTLENLLFVLRERLPSTNIDVLRSRCVQMLGQLGLAGFEHHYPSQLSGGMKQRVALGRAFILNPELLILDEPFSALDVQTKASLKELLFSLLSSFPTTVFLVTHDPREAAAIADQVILLGGYPTSVLERVYLAVPRDDRDEDYIENQTREISALLGFGGHKTKAQSMDIRQHIAGLLSPITL